MTTAPRLLNAQAELKAAQDEQAKQLRETNLRKLREVRHERKLLEKQYERDERAIFKADAERELLRGEVELCNNALALTDQLRPEYADIDPDDPDVIHWNEGRAHALKRRDAAVKAYKNGVPGPDRAAVLKVKGQIDNLIRVERNLAESLRGHAPGSRWGEGGLFRVS